MQPQLPLVNIIAYQITTIAGIAILFPIFTILKYLMSQRVKQIDQDLIIEVQWTEPHSPWQNPAELNGIKYLKSHAEVLVKQNPAELNGIKYLKSHAEVLVNRTDAPDNLWFLAQV
jgi:hypothetical protein